MIGAKAGRDSHHLFQAQPEERGAREQDKSERHLRHDEAVAKALRSAVRTHDTVARLGGEEFALLLPDADVEGAYEIAERARALISGVELPGATLSSSAGGAATGAGPERSGELFDAADRALYEAKRLGRDRTELARTLG